MFDYRKRITALRGEMHKKKLDAFVTNFLPHIRYVTGYSGSNGIAIVTMKEIFFLTDFRYKEQIRSEVVTDVSVAVRGDLLVEAVHKKVFSGCRHVGFENEHLTYNVFLELRENFSSVHFVGVEGIVEHLASQKDEQEISLIVRAASITDKVFSEILPSVKPGVSELELSAEISYLQKRYGAEKDAFDTIVASGARSALPHGIASSKKISNKEFVTFDFGCVYHGYCSDLTRTVAVGKPTREMRRVYDIVKEAQCEAIGHARSGISGKDLDNVARRSIRKNGYGKYFGHSLGHGIGLQIHEMPKISDKNVSMLHNNMVVTIEPGIYLPGAFGVRIEDDVVLKENGCEVLTSSPKELIIL